MDTFQQRAQKQDKARKVIRAYFESQGFIEIQTPTIVPAVAIEPHIEPICLELEDEFTGQRFSRFLMTSPELLLKEALSEGGLSRIYQLGPVFRDGEITKTHRPEFTMLEWYRAHESLNSLILDCQAILSRVSRALLGSSSIELACGTRLDLGEAIEVLEVDEAWKRYANVDLGAALLQVSRGRPFALAESVESRWPNRFHSKDFEDLFAEVMDKFIEPKIGREGPVALTKWPLQLGALAAADPQAPLWAQRFELYAGGLELGNAYYELVDPREQTDRFLRDLKCRARSGKKDLPLPNRFLRVLSCVPNCAGMALGFERLLMLISQKADIDEVGVFAGLWPEPHNSLF